MGYFNETIQSEIKDTIKSMVSNKDIEGLNTLKGFESRLDKFFDEIMGTDDGLYSIYRRHESSYCTWRINLELNEYHFGSKLAEALLITPSRTKTSIITHDEDKEFTLEDFEEILRESYDEFIYDVFDSLPLFTGDNEEEMHEAIEEIL